MRIFSRPFFIVIVCGYVFAGLPCLVVSADPIPHPPRFQHILTDEAQSVGSTLVIHQDKFGFIWLGGKSGLARFDGDSLVFYRHSVSDPNSISNDVIWDIEEDEEGNLWLATEGGLNFFHRETQTFRHFKHDSEDPASLRNNRVNFIFVDQQGLFWLGTNDGLDRFERESETFIHYPLTAGQMALGTQFVLDMDQDEAGIYYLATGFGFKVWNPHTDVVETYTHEYGNPDSIQSNLSRSVKVTSKNEVWVGTEIGLHRFNPEEKNFTYIPSPGSGDAPFVRAAIWQITEDHNGDIWVSGDGAGLSRLDQKEEQLTSYFASPLDPNTPLTNISRSVFVDRNGDIWIGHFPSGLSMIQSYNTTFQTFRNITNDRWSVNSNNIRGIAEDANGNLWLGADGGGLNFYDAVEGTYKIYRNDVFDSNTPATNSLQNVIVASDQTIWFGMWNGGAAQLNPHTGKFTHVQDVIQSSDFFSYPHVSAIIEGLDQRIYIGSMDGGLTIYDPRTKRAEMFFHDPTNDTSISNNRVWCLLQSASGLVYVGTHEGFNTFDPKTREFTRFQHGEDNVNSLSDNWVHTLYEDSRGLIWVGTHGGGINIFDPQAQTFKVIAQKNGLANNVIQSIIEDDLGYIWIGSNGGLTRYDYDNKTFRSFTSVDGIQGALFNRNAAIKTANGDLIFGGSNGYTRFTPAKVEKNAFLPPLVITSLIINNESIRANHRSLDKNILLADAIRLDHTQNIFTLEFAALNFRNPQLNHYAYILEGFDDTWQVVGDRDSATYTNLNPGRYTFKVRGTNNEWEWSHHMAEVEIVVSAPPWRSWWAYILYALIIAAVIGGYIANQRKVINYQRTIVARLKKIDRVKDTIVASTSHELKTPLFGIIGLAENIANRAANRLDKGELFELSMIIASSKRLACHVQDILDHSHLEENAIELEREAVSLYELIEMISAILSPTLRYSPVRLQHTISKTLPAVFADNDRLQQIFYNLISNAMKFTERGEIRITATKMDEATISITIADTGCGIEKHKRESLFEAFVQLDEVDSRIQGGTGLGLTIAYNLVRLHGGKMHIQSEVDQGTQVTFTLPTTEQEPKSIELSSNLASRIDAHSPHIPSPHVPDTAGAPEETTNKHQPRILIVDDEAVNRMVLQGFLKDDPYSLVLASNGDEALQTLIQQPDIDLILLDVMMPGMSGYDVARTIRKQQSAIELPILFITAKAQVEDLQEAYEAGGNDFLPKPVTRQELIVRIRHHLHILTLCRSGNPQSKIEDEIKRL